MNVVDKLNIPDLGSVDQSELIDELVSCGVSKDDAGRTAATLQKVRKHKEKELELKKQEWLKAYNVFPDRYKEEIRKSILESLSVKVQENKEIVPVNQATQLTLSKLAEVILKTRTFTNRSKNYFTTVALNAEIKAIDEYKNETNLDERVLKALKELKTYGKVYQHKDDLTTVTSKKNCKWRVGTPSSEEHIWEPNV